MSELLAVLVGGALGAVARFACTRRAGGSFPWTVLVVNVSGTFLLGVLTVSAPAHPTARALLTTGFCGAFTTFSTYALDVVGMLRAGRFALAVVYGVATVGLSLTEFVLGALAAGIDAGLG